MTILGLYFETGELLILISSLILTFIEIIRNTKSIVLFITGALVGILIFSKINIPAIEVYRGNTKLVVDTKIIDGKVITSDTTVIYVQKSK